MSQNTPPPNDKPHRPMFDQEDGAHKSSPTSPPPRRSSPGVPSSGMASARVASTSPRQRSGAHSGKRKTTRRRKKKGGKGLIILLLIFVVLGIALFAIYNSIQSRISGRGTEAGVTPEEHWTAPEYKGKGIVNFIVCGIDYDNEDGSAFTSAEKIGNTDMILYVHYDTNNSKAVIMQIPRDIYVGTAPSTGGTRKINSLYYKAEDTSNRASALSKVLMDQYKLPTDFYVTVDMDALKQLVAIKGYIHMYLPVGVDNIDPKHPNVKWDKGWQYFDSETIELLLRNRSSSSYKGQADIGRLAMQQSFYSALFREFTALTPSDLYMWLGVLLNNVKTDNDDLFNLAGLAIKALNLKGENITFIRPSVSGADFINSKGKSVSLLSIVPEDIASLLNEYLRPEGESYTLSQLNIPTLPVNYIGIVPRSIRTMGDIQAVEDPLPAKAP